MDVDIAVSIVSAGSALLGTLVGGAITFGLQSSERRANRTEKRAGLAAGLAAEIQVYLKMVEMRRYDELAKRLLTVARSGVDVPLNGFISANEREKENFPFYAANISDIGLLGPDICRDLTTFHSLIGAVRSTIIRAEDGFYSSLSPQSKADLIEEELSVWSQMSADGKMLAANLVAIATRP